MSAELANFYDKTRDARKIIVVDLGFLGDTVHLIPALHELKRNYSQAQLHVLTSPLGCEVLALVSCVDRAWPVELSPQKRTLRQQWQVRRELRQQQFDVAFNFNGTDRTIFMTALTGAPWRVAYHGGRSHFWNRWLVPFWIPFIEPTGPLFERRREMLQLCGLQLTPARFDLAVPKQAQDWAASQFSDEAIHFSVSASTHLKEWPLEHWIELGKRFSSHSQIRIVATGSENPRERSRLEAFACSLKSSKVQVVCGVSIARLAALLSRCSLHVGADSGVLHLAIALGLPTISLFRDYPNIRGWLPRGPQHRSLTAKCACGGRTDGPCQKLPTAACLKEIGPDAVGRAVMETLESRATLNEVKNLR